MVCAGEQEDACDFGREVDVTATTATSEEWRVEQRCKCVSCSGGLPHDEDDVKVGLWGCVGDEFSWVGEDPADGVADVLGGGGKLYMWYQTVVWDYGEEALVCEIGAEVGVVQVVGGCEDTIASNEAASVDKEQDGCECRCWSGWVVNI